MSAYTLSDEDIGAEDIAAVEDGVRRFMQTEVKPHLDAWEEAGQFPRALYQRAADLGWLGMGYPEQFGGTPAPWKLRNAMTVALARTGGSGGLMASLFSHNIGLPPVVRHGSPELQQRIIPDVLAGKKIAALAITEPGGGTDVSALKTTARLDGDEYVVDGEKVFITSGMRADWLTVAVRTDLQNKGPMGISMLMVPGDAVGLSRSPLKKMGWLCSDTAQIRFDGVRVPVGNLVGEEGIGLQNHPDQLQWRAPVDVGHGAGLLGVLLRRGPELGAAAQDLWHRAGGPPGDSPQADGHENAHRVHPRLAASRDRAGRCG